MDAAPENSEVTIKAEASDQLHRSTETIYSESSEEFQSKCKNAANILQKRKQVLSLLDGDSSPYRSVNFFPTRALSCTRLLKRNSMNGCSEKIMAEKALQIKQLHNELAEARYQINELANENRLLLNIQKRQATALRKYEGKKAKLPQLMHSHSEEIRVLKSKLKELRGENLEKDQHLKGLHTELLTLKEKHRHLLKLARDRRLKEREQLSKQVEDLQQIIKEQDIKIQTLNRKVMLETKTCKHQLTVEISHHRETKKTLNEALEKIAKLERMLETKEKYIANLSPKRTLSKHYQPHSLSLASWNAKTPRFSTHKTINYPEIDSTRNQNPAIEEESSEATYTASCTATSLGSPGSTNNIQTDREVLMTAEARYQARRLRLAKKINRIKEKLSDHHDDETNFTNDQSINTYFSDDNDDNDTDTFYDEKALNSEIEAVSRRTSLESCNVRYIDCIDQPQLANNNHNIQKCEQDVENTVQKISEISAEYVKRKSETSNGSSVSDAEEYLHGKKEDISHVNKELNMHISSGIVNQNENPNLHEQIKDSLSPTNGDSKREVTVFEHNQNITEDLEFKRKSVAEGCFKENSIICIPDGTSFTSENISNQKNTENGTLNNDEFLELKEKAATQTEPKSTHIEGPYSENRRNSANDALPKINTFSENHSYLSTGMSLKNHAENRYEEFLSENATKINLPSTYALKSKSSLQNVSQTVDLSVNAKSIHGSEQNFEKYKSLKCEKEVQNQNHSKLLTQDPAKKSKLLAALKAIDDGKDPETQYIQTFGLLKSEANKNVFGNEFQTKGNNIFSGMDAKSLSTSENITFPLIDNNGSRRFSTISYWEYHEKQGNGNKMAANKDELLRELFDKHDTEHTLKVQSSCSSEGKELLLDALKPSQNLLEKN